MSNIWHVVCIDWILAFFISNMGYFWSLLVNNTCSTDIAIGFILYALQVGQWAIWHIYRVSSLILCGGSYFYTSNAAVITVFNNACVHVHAFLRVEAGWHTCYDNGNHISQQNCAKQQITLWQETDHHVRAWNDGCLTVVPFQLYWCHLLACNLCHGCPETCYP